MAWVEQADEAAMRMKLTSCRDKDKMHIRDMIGVGLVDAAWPARFPPELAARLQHLLDPLERIEITEAFHARASDGPREDLSVSHTSPSLHAALVPSFAVH